MKFIILKLAAFAVLATASGVYARGGSYGALDGEPCYSTSGADQRSCGPGAVCAGAPGNQGCDQRGLVNPTCLTSGCNQDGSTNPSCVGSKCSQIGAKGNPSCVGTNCCWTGPGKYPGNCAYSGSCNSSAKGCRGSEFDEDEAEKVKTFLRSVAKILE